MTGRDMTSLSRSTEHEHLDSCLPAGRGGDCRRCGNGDAQSAESRAERNAAIARAETRGTAWVMGAFVICPCHLPLTLGLAAVLLAGTAAGAALRAHPFVAGTIVTVVWMAATARGIWILRQVRV
jgi:hypothetical protein